MRRPLRDAEGCGVVGDHQFRKHRGNGARLPATGDLVVQCCMRSRSSKPPASAVESGSTVRERIAQALREAELTAHEISQRASVLERDVAEHLRHLEHSLVHAGERLAMSAPLCLKCGFAFKDRERHSRPSRCPQCKSERISPPSFRIVR